MSSHGDIFNQVRAASDIVEIIGEHIALKKGGREFKGLCPFHPDHRPSMAVVPHKQIFHCFVCGTGGDVFKFVQQYHKMTAGESLRMLAQRAGIKLPELSKRPGGGGSDKDKDGFTARERIGNTNEWACVFFEKHLRTAQGKPGLDYFHSRGLSEETIAKFRLGMSPEGWTGLVNAWHGRPAHDSSGTGPLLEAGLIKQRQDSSPYDAFRNRVIFPIIDATGGAMGKGRVIAFGGRILAEKRDEAGNVVEAKYLNSPDSPLFNKSESLYGLNLARQQIIRTRTAIVVEGYMDVIACHQAGVSNVIATLGTALTPDHARVLKNYAQTIVLVFDSDDAGRRAADRAMEVFVRGSLDIKIAAVPDGKDPCDFCMKNGGEAFQKLVDAATDALTYKWQQLQIQFHGTDSISGRQESITTYLRFLAPGFEAIADPIRRGLLLSKISNLVGMSLADTQGTLKKFAQQSGNQYWPSNQNPNQSQGMQLPGAENEGGNSAGESGEDHAAVIESRINLRQLSGLDAAEGWVLGALLVRPTLYHGVCADLSLNLFNSFRPLAIALLEYFENHGDLESCNLAELTTTLDSGELVHQAIELEGRIADWHEPATLSPNHTKLLQHLSADRGLSLESLIQDSIKELQSARGTTDPHADSDLAPVPEMPGGAIGVPSAEEQALAEAFKQIAQIKSRNTTGGNRRIVGESTPRV